MKRSPSRTSKWKTKTRTRKATTFSPKSKTKKTMSPASSIPASPRTKLSFVWLTWGARPEGVPRKWGHSSAGRAPAWHAGGQRFDPAWLHHFRPHHPRLFSAAVNGENGGAKRLSLAPRDQRASGSVARARRRRRAQAINALNSDGEI